MREVIVTVGPRASGKSCLCDKVLALDPSLVLVSRDKITIELCGSTSPDPYSGGHQYANERMWETLTELLELRADVRVILDAWNGSSRERTSINQKLRDLGVNRIKAWYFVTPVEYVEEWFWRKPGIAKMEEMGDRQGQGLTFYSADAPRCDYELFHKYAEEINSDGFDEIVRVNPLSAEPELLL